MAAQTSGRPSRSLLLPGIPAQRAPPFDGAQAGQTGVAGSRRQRQTPQDVSGERRMRLLAYRRPETAAVRRLGAAQLARRRIDRSPCTGQAQPELPVVPERSGYRQWLPTPEIQAGNRFIGIHREHQRPLRRRTWQYFQGDLGQYAQGTQAAGQQARNVIAGNVLHDLAAEIEHLPGAVDQPDPEHEIAHGPRLRPTRTGQASRYAAANACSRKAWRLERQQLPLLRQSRFNLGQRRAAAGRDIEFGRFVSHNAAVSADIEEFPGQHPAIEILAAGAANTQGGLAVVRRPDCLNDLVECHQKRSSSGNLSWPRCTCMRPYSAQRCRLGTALPGLSSPCSSKACLMPRKASSSGVAY